RQLMRRLRDVDTRGVSPVPEERRARLHECVVRLVQGVGERLTLFEQSFGFGTSAADGRTQRGPPVRVQEIPIRLATLENRDRREADLVRPGDVTRRPAAACLLPHRARRLPLVDGQEDGNSQITRLERLRWSSGESLHDGESGERGPTREVVS